MLKESPDKKGREMKEDKPEEVVTQKLFVSVTPLLRLKNIV